MSNYHDQYNVLIESRLTRLETLMETQQAINGDIKQCLYRIESRMDKFEDRMSRLDAHLYSQFVWIIGTIIAMFGIPLVANFLRAIHWMN
jgi:hypothetical protein